MNSHPAISPGYLTRLSHPYFSTWSQSRQQVDSGCHRHIAALTSAALTSATVTRATVIGATVISTGMVRAGLRSSPSCDLVPIVPSAARSRISVEPRHLSMTSSVNRQTSVDPSQLLVTSSVGNVRCADISAATSGVRFAHGRADASSFSSGRLQRLRQKIARSDTSVTPVFQGRSAVLLDACRSLRFSTADVVP